MRSRRRDAETIEPTSLPSGQPCTRCNGERVRDNVNGGWLSHVRHVNGGWYAFARCCPDCAFGSYRNRCTNTPFYCQFTADTREIGMFLQALKPGMTLSQAAAKMPEGPLRMRFVLEAQTIGGAERGGWQQYNQPRLSERAVEVGF